MARYIDADKLNTRVRGNNSQRTMWREIKGMVDNAPTADVVPRSEVEREIGEEIYRIIGECHNETWVCLLLRKLADGLINGDKSNVETCIACGDVIPEGRWICPNCEEEKK